MKLKMLEIFDSRWPKFRQEIVSIICLSSIQIWFGFHLPVFIRLGEPWNVILAVVICILGPIGIVFLFSYADKFASFFNPKSLDDMPYASIMKKFSMLFRLVIMHVFFFIACQNDLYSSTRSYWIFQYIYSLVMLVLLYRAAHRWPSEE